MVMYIIFLIFSTSGVAGSVATLLHDAIMNPAEGILLRSIPVNNESFILILLLVHHKVVCFWVFQITVAGYAQEISSTIVILSRDSSFFFFFFI